VQHGVQLNASFTILCSRTPQTVGCDSFCASVMKFWGCKTLQLYKVSQNNSIALFIIGKKFQNNIVFYN